MNKPFICFGTWGVIWLYYQTIHDGLIPTNAINWWYPCIFDTKTPWKRHSITRRVWVMFSLAMSSLLKHHIVYTAWNPDWDTDGMKNKLSLWYVYVRRNTNYSACNPGSLSHESRLQSPTRHQNFISTWLRQSVTDTSFSIADDELRYCVTLCINDIELNNRKLED